MGQQVRCACFDSIRTSGVCTQPDSIKFFGGVQAKSMACSMLTSQALRSLTLTGGHPGSSFLTRPCVCPKAGVCLQGACCCQAAGCCLWGNQGATSFWAGAKLGHICRQAWAMHVAISGCSPAAARACTGAFTSCSSCLNTQQLPAPAHPLCCCHLLRVSEPPAAASCRTLGICHLLRALHQQPSICTPACFIHLLVDREHSSCHEQSAPAKSCGKPA